MFGLGLTGEEGFLLLIAVVTISFIAIDKFADTLKIFQKSEK